MNAISGGNAFRGVRITYKIVSLTYDVLATAKPSISPSLTIHAPRCTRSSINSSLYRPAAISSRRTILNRSFRYSASILWDSLPPELRRPTTAARLGQISYPNLHFCKNSKTHLFHKSYPGSSESSSAILHPDPTHLTCQIPGHLTNITASIIKLTSSDRPGLH